MEPNQYQQPQYPPPPGYAPPPGYEQPPAYDPNAAAAYGYAQPSAYPGYPPAAPQTSGMAIASLVLSLLGLIGLALIGPILGVIFGHMALGEIKRSNGAVGGQGLAMAGLIIGYVELGLTLLFCAVIAIVIIASAASQPSSFVMPVLR